MMRSFPAILLLLAGAQLAVAGEDAAVERGKYLYAAADCAGCHGGARGGPPAEGRALRTPFGIFHPPNISSDLTAGIGGWNDADFRTALRFGIAPHGKRLFPVFPFTAFTGMSDRDISDLRAYILSLPGSSAASRPHEVTPPFGWRALMIFWRVLFFRAGPLAPDPAHDAQWNRGRYLVRAVAHCGECHTPRNIFGALRDGRAFAGNVGGPDGQNAPNITSDKETGIGSWSLTEIAHLLKTGETPDFDSVASGMAEVIRGTRSLTDDDRLAMAVYLKTIPPIHTPQKMVKPANR